ncbi:actinodin1 [Lepisosteus oculatus]|uniref:actinodin1 n=1 Tax=Lepisosteus oculatus TaxID=7918 RepID=UPI0035F518EB
MACLGSKAFSCVFAGVLLATALLPDLLVASPVGQRLKGDAGDKETAGEENAQTSGFLKKLVRSRRNISWYKQHADFWGWYKYFTDNGNQEGINELDRVYLQYLQNKNRAEGRRSYDLYLRHLSEVYKACANSDDPECISELTSKPKPKPEVPKPAPTKGCDPYRDPNCQASRAPVMFPAPYKSTPMGYYYYVPAPQPLLSAQQKAELLRICNPSDIECLQYHLRAAYGYKTVVPTVSAPSYAYLGCDPEKDPYCMQKKKKAEVYHQYPNCDPEYDPYCTPERAQGLQMPSQLNRCNPLFDENCNPLTATRMVVPPKPECDPYYDPSCRQEYRPKDEPAPSNGCDPRYDPYCLQSPSAVQTEAHHDPRHYPRIKGKTKEGYDCYMYYDEECYPVHSSSSSRASAASTMQDCDPYDPSCPLYYSANNPRRSMNESPNTECHPYDPSCRKPSPQQPRAPETYHPEHNPAGYREGVIEPDPDCDPEYDHNCRLRRSGAKPAQDAPHQESQAADEHKEEDPQPSYEQQQYDPYQDRQEDPYNPYAGYEGQDHHDPRYEAAQKGYEDQYPRYDESHGHYESSSHDSAGEYKKK